MSDDQLLVEKSGSKLIISLNRPQVVNALTEGMLVGINAALDEAEKDDSVLVVVLRGNGGKGFCSGLDRKDMARMSEEGRGREIFGLIYGTAKRIDAFDKPVVSIIHGHTIAAGGQLATAADLIVAGENLKLVEPEMRSTGFNDESWPVRLGRTLGPVRAKRYVLLAEPVSGQEALQLGLVSLCVPNDELEETGLRLADQIAGYLPNVVRSTLKLIDSGAGSKS